ncbi:MAG TPA: thioredoxin-disulfide reductase, partial [Bacteroidales bacterium]|nr:thioredoxin-disulfide reductase [Bacteroidales bacterium]
FLIEADAVIIATGATAKYLGLESEEKFKGSGVSACATCDGFFYRGQDVAVVGGGDTAAEEATYLAGLCRKVYLIVRKPYLRASKAMQDRVTRTANIEVLYEHVTKEIVGGQTVEGVILTNSKGEEVRKDITGFFVAIGHEPNSDIFAPYVDRDETGYIITVPGTTKTNVPGVFACGDVQDKHYRQAVTAAGSGCMAALDTERFLG